MPGEEILGQSDLRPACQTTMTALRTFSTLENVAEELLTMRDYRIVCLVCKTVRQPSLEELKACLAFDFPRCCGYTMLLESKPKARPE